MSLTGPCFWKKFHFLQFFPLNYQNVKHLVRIDTKALHCDICVSENISPPYDGRDKMSNDGFLNKQNLEKFVILCLND